MLAHLPIDWGRLQAAWQEEEEEDRFWREHRQDLLEAYPDQFVAVYQGSVIAAASDWETLEACLQARGLDPSRVWIRFVTDKPGLHLRGGLRSS
ncbi:MAG: hypothetical protein HY690_20210 [Chloroflexi bacterium]|nr:hypothetical protein [Chloroflexota bacterium]